MEEKTKLTAAIVSLSWASVNPALSTRARMSIRASSSLSLSSESTDMLLSRPGPFPRRRRFGELPCSFDDNIPLINLKIWLTADLSASYSLSASSCKLSLLTSMSRKASSTSACATVSEKRRRARAWASRRTPRSVRADVYVCDLFCSSSSLEILRRRT